MGAVTERLRRRAARCFKGILWAFAEGSLARVQLTMYQHSDTPGAERQPCLVPDWHPERVVPLSDLPDAEQRWWRNLEERLR
jgi:hypothetical protein